MLNKSTGKKKDNCWLWLLLFTSSVAMFPSLSFSQTESEIETLNMFFSEEELVTTPTRTPNPISKVAENISIVTADEIEAMNAHSLPEVLERVTGIYIYYMVNDFQKDEFLLIEGAIDGSNNFKEERHVLLLLDGVPWNFMSNGKPITNTIPVNIIKRLEIIKGPASSVWGSSLGGVINIVTKETGGAAEPSGTVSGSFGEKNVRDYYGALAGKAGKAGYYLYAGRQDSDGFEKNRYFKRNSLFGKFDIPFSQDSKITLTAGYAKPNYNSGDDIEGDFAVPIENNALITKADLIAPLTEAFSLEASLYDLKQSFDLQYRSLSTDELSYKWFGEERKTGGTTKFLFAEGMHNGVFGLDINNTVLDREETGVDSIHPGITKWALFLNDTISIGSLSITPGVRYDKNNVNGDFTSPSLGATYRFDNRTVLRVSAAKGLSLVPLLYTSGETYSNPSLKPEEIFSIQGGIESVIANYFHAKASIFHHDVKDAITMASTFNNAGKTKRTGTELEVETLPFYNLSMDAGVSFFNKKTTLDDDDPATEDDTDRNIYSYHLLFAYKDKSLSAQLAGNYTWWNLPLSETGHYVFIWDFNLIKNIYSKKSLTTELFFTAHNIFNGTYNVRADDKNPRRWIEAGLRVKF